MHEEPGLDPSHELLLILERRRLAALHAWLRETHGLTEITWFIVDLDGALGRFCGVEIVGAPLVERRRAGALRRGTPPSMSFPIDGPDALLIVEQLAPALVSLVRGRSVGAVPIVIVNRDDRANLAWLDDFHLGIRS